MLLGVTGARKARSERNRRSDGIMNEDAGDCGETMRRTGMAAATDGGLLRQAQRDRRNACIDQSCREVAEV